MKINCQIVEDLLPLYLDEVCSEQSKQAVEEHLRTCEKCRRLIDSTKVVPIPYVEPDKSSSDRAIKHGFKKVRIRWIISVVLSVLIISSTFIGWNHYQSRIQTELTEYKIALSVMELLKRGEYEKCFEYFDVDGIKNRWLQDDFEEGELTDFESKAKEIFLKYAKKTEALGGIEKYSYIGMYHISSRGNGTPIYRVSFRIVFEGEYEVFCIDVSKNGVEKFTADGSFVTDPLAQFSIWPEYLWQHYQGCYYDPDLGDYVYKDKKN